MFSFFLGIVWAYEEYCIAADDAYVCDKYFITPVPQARAPSKSAENGFNFFISVILLVLEWSWITRFLAINVDSNSWTRYTEIFGNIVQFCMNIH